MELTQGGTYQTLIDAVAEQRNRKARLQETIQKWVLFLLMVAGRLDAKGTIGFSLVRVVTKWPETQIRRHGVGVPKALPKVTQVWPKAH